MEFNFKFIDNPHAVSPFLLWRKGLGDRGRNPTNHYTKSCSLMCLFHEARFQHTTVPNRIVRRRLHGWWCISPYKKPYSLKWLFHEARSSNPTSSNFQINKLSPHILIIKYHSISVNYRTVISGWFFIFANEINLQNAHFVPQKYPKYSWIQGWNINIVKIKVSCQHDFYS